VYPDYDAIKKVAPSVSIKPEHKETMSEVLKEYETTRTGPAMYNPDYKLTERRSDVGVVQIRQPYFDAKPETDDRPTIDPEPVKPNKLVFKYHEPTEHEPQHPPQSVLNPGRWVFYDVDLDAVRE
jgi:hypothetical protein